MKWFQIIFNHKILQRLKLVFDQRQTEPPKQLNIRLKMIFQSSSPVRIPRHCSQAATLMILPGVNQ